MKLYERFLNYVMYDTMSLVGQNTVPSTPGQRVLAEALTEEIRSFGIEDVRLDEKGYIYGSVPANIDEEVPVIGFPMPIRLRSSGRESSKTMTGV